jgi:hypothetical protein
MRLRSLTLVSAIVLIVGCSDSGASTGPGGAGGSPASTSAATGSTSTGSPASATSSSASASTSNATSSSTGGGGVTPPLGGSSGGSGGPAPVNGTVQQAGTVSYRLVVPASYAPGTPTPFLVVYSGTEGGQAMTSNLQQVAAFTSTNGFIEAVLDGVTYNGDGAAGATVLDAIRAQYDVDNDRTYLLGESAGTSAAEELGFHLRESYFAAYWANDVNAVDGPAQTASELGFAPWGQVGPGGQFATANAIVANMQAAAYRLPNPAPYAGQGAGTHGDSNQFIAAVSWFPGKSRN